jgi:CxxC-x17-CxxC domain-containing protein
MAERADQRCVCKDCRREFVFTAAEREQFAARGHFHVPGRCPACREGRAQRKQEHAAVRGLHTVTCAKCGARTRVPFLPRTEKPVYCRACFLEKRAD